ncbi:MAG TPA: hypothetical protein VKH63_18430 [Candidatus Acidoferrum sp.]|nr:hypothetical protein [Candidatus Acidoferrum sp.]
MSDSPEFDSLNSVKYLFLRHLSEPRDNSLRLVVEEAVQNRFAPPPVPSDNPGLDEILKRSWPVESIQGCKTFELTWNRYAAYLVTEELVGSGGSYDHETYTGRLLRVYTKSHFLDYLARDTGGHVDPVQHYKLLCLNHLIDIGSYGPPDIRLTGPSSAPPLRIQ